MEKIKILLADNSFLIRQGLRSIIEEYKDFKLVGEAEKAIDLHEKLLLNNPHVLIIDYGSAYFCFDDILVIRECFPQVNILAITNYLSRKTISGAIENGVMSHLLKDCSKDEIIEAILNTARGEKFFCGKVVNIALRGSDTTSENNSSLSENVKPDKSISCDGIKLSVRELEIIQCVAEGLVNKQIAEKLFLSTHTIATHRKNIMSKIGVNNSAGLVMFAVKQNLISQPSPANL